MSTTTAPTPPPAAVAQDPHWTATRDRLNRRSRPILTLTICDDYPAQQALAEARSTEQRLALAAEHTPDDTSIRKDLAEAKKRTARAQKILDEASIRLRFQALDRKTYRELRSEHRPTEEQADDGFDFNLDTLAPVIIAASSLDGITEEDAARYLDEWSQAEADALINTAFGVQREERMDLGKG